MRLLATLLYLLCALPVSLVAQDAKNIAFGKLITAQGTTGSLKKVVDGAFASPGERWNADPAVVLHSASSEVVIDFGSMQALKALLLQADNNDVYLVEAAKEKDGWEFVHRFLPNSTGEGLQVQHVVLPEIVLARYVRLRPAHGDKAYSIAEFQAFERTPSRLFERIGRQKPSLAGVASSLLTQERADMLKRALSAIGIVFLIWIVVARLSESEDDHRRIRSVLFICVSVLAGMFWFNGFRFHFSGYVHYWDFYHYYMGAKYSPELGYSSIYDCGVVADFEDGYTVPESNRVYRNLTANTIQDVSHLAAMPHICKDHFSQERWEDFKTDIRYFRAKMSQTRWHNIHLDHGFNATPVWSISGFILTNMGGASDRQIVSLASIDAVLMVVMWFFLWWAFGWEVMCIAMIYWGTNYPARFWWTGGSFLRHDWLFWCVLGVSCLKRNLHGLAGATLTYAALLRVFPGALLVPICIKYVYESVSQRKLLPYPNQRRFALGAIGTGVILVLLSFFPAQSKNVWYDFIQNSRKHLETPLTNNMGLKTVVKYKLENRTRFSVDETQTDPFGVWKREQLETFDERKIIFYVIVLTFFVLLARAAIRHEDWTGAVMGVALVPIATELTCYYYGILLLLGCLWVKRMRAGIMLLVFSWLSYFVSEFWKPYDEHFVYISAIVVLFSFYLVWSLGRDGVGETEGK